MAIVISAIAAVAVTFILHRRFEKIHGPAASSGPSCYNRE